MLNLVSKFSNLRVISVVMSLSFTITYTYHLIFIVTETLHICENLVFVDEVSSTSSI